MEGRLGWCIAGAEGSGVGVFWGNEGESSKGSRRSAKRLGVNGRVGEGQGVCECGD